MEHDESKKLEERNRLAWRLRASGMSLEEIGEVLVRADGSGERGVSKARAWQIVRREFERRAALAKDSDELSELFRAARMGCLRGVLESEMERVGSESGNGRV